MNDAVKYNWPVEQATENSSSDCKAFLVVGDHPIMRRPDKAFVGVDAKKRADKYALMLREHGYENVEVENI